MLLHRRAAGWIHRDHWPVTQALQPHTEHSMRTRNMAPCVCAQASSQTRGERTSKHQRWKSKQHSMTKSQMLPNSRPLPPYAGPILYTPNSMMGCTTCTTKHTTHRVNPNAWHEGKLSRG